MLDGPTGRLNASKAGVTRVRTALEGSRGFTLGGGRRSLTPSVEVGLRRDGGDAETGAGMDVGSGLAFTDAVTGLSLDVRMRTLMVHQADGFTEHGMSLSLGWVRSVEPAGADGAGDAVVGRTVAGRGRGAVGRPDGLRHGLAPGCTGPATASTRRWATGCSTRGSGSRWAQRGTPSI